jgi:energy-coupling factor transporter ATP-binding protein EcfA2
MESLFCRIISWKNATIGERRSKHGHANAEDMENRLEFFRQQMAAFDGAADPRGAIENGFYIEEPHKSATSDLFKRIALKPESKNLLIGGIGSGKTTQLLKIQQLLQSTIGTEIFPHYVDITEYEHPEAIQPGLLNAVVGLELIRLLQQAHCQVDQSLKSIIEEYAGGTNTLAAALTTATRVRSGGILSYYSTDPYRITNTLLKLKLQFSTHFSKSPFFLFDGLDRVHDAERFIRASTSSLDDVGIGFLIVGPVSTLYSKFADSLDYHFNHFEYRTAFDVEDDVEAYKFFKNVLNSRSNQSNFLRTPAMEKLICMSGGILRDLINLGQESIQEAYLSDSEHVELEHVSNAVSSLGRAKILGLDDEDSRFLLASLTENTIKFSSSPKTIALLARGRILEYRYPKRRFVIHPVLHELLFSQVPA